MQEIESALRKLAVFVPELKPLVPEIVVALQTVEKAQTILAPALKRVEAQQPAFLEFGEAMPELEPLMPEVASAIALIGKLRALLVDYQARIAKV
jgi:hypothetical protein